MITTNIPTTMSVPQAHNLISELQEKIRKSKEAESREMARLAKQEINAKYLKKLSSTVKKMYKKLNRKNFPTQILCSHFGVGESVGNDYLQMSIKDDQLLITLYRSQNTSLPNGEGIGYTVKEHQKKIKTIKSALNANLVDRWNGSENQNGVSLLLDKKVPQALKQAIAAYHNLPDVFNPTRKENQAYKNFDQWYNS